MAISGFLAGLGGAIETQGVFDRYEAGFNVGLGFDGITVALLARVQPLLAIPAALLLGVMRAGQTQMAFEADVAPGDHRRHPGDHPPARLRPDRRALVAAPAPAA